MSERKVLRVGRNDGEMDMDMGQMSDSTPPLEPEEMNNMPPANVPEPANEFDTNFDAGVEADEETDPKRFIQQLTGKLSQSLRQYNEQLPQPDADLNKYVAGMITKQAINGLSSEDVDEILDKIKSGEDFSGEEEGEQQNAQPDNDNVNTDDNMGQAQQTQPMQQAPMNNESVLHGKKINEITNGTLERGEEAPKDTSKPKNDKESYAKKPFTSPNFN